MNETEKLKERVEDLEGKYRYLTNKVDKLSNDCQKLREIMDMHKHRRLSGKSYVLEEDLEFGR